MFTKIGNFAIKNRVWIILGWVLAALLLFLLAPSLSQVGTMTESNFLPQDSESLRARQLTAEYFPQTQSASTVTLVFYNSNKLGDSDLAYAEQVSDWLSSGETPFKVANVSSIFTNPELKARLISPDGTTMLLNAGLEKVAFESDSMTTTQDIRDYLKSAPQGLEIYVSGQVGVYSDLFESLNQSINLTTIITILLVIVLLIVIFRSPVAALVPLLTIGLAFIVARGVMGIIGSAGVPIWSQIEIFLIVMIFGIGTDYCLFLISRFREELGRQENRREAMKAAVGKIGVVITASALAVVVGMAGMAVAQYQMIQTMGPLLGVAIVLTLLAALTLAPALASVFGHKLFWPLHEQLRSQNKSKRPGLWDRIARLTTGRPIIVATATIVIMLIPYLALPTLNRSFDQLAEIPASSQSIAGFKILQQHYDIGEMDPLTVILVAPEGQTITEPNNLKALNQLSEEIRKVNGVVKIQSVLQPDGSGQTLSELTVSGQLDTIRTNINSMFSSASSNPEILFSNSVDAGFAQLNGYLRELSTNFNWMQSEPSFQGLISSLQGMQQMIDQIKSGSSEVNLGDMITQYQSLNSNLQTLAQRFTENGDPAFISPTLMASSPDSQNLMNLFFSQDQRATKMYIVLNSFPQSDAALNAVSDARNTIQNSLQGTALQSSEVVIGGTSAELADVRQVLDQDFTRIMAVVLAAIFIVLALLLRSLIAPLYLLITVLLSYGTTLGIVTWIFQGILGQDGVSFLIPIIVLVLLIALGSDYNIFLMSRVKEESQSQPTRMGARIAAIATGGVITACGIILAGTFGALVITPIRTLMQIGAAVSIGVLIDTFLVRALLVPAIASLLGRWNWWPTRHG